MDNINCKKCRYYYITWDKFFPHGCKTLKFKSKQLPSIDVFQSSREKCLYYEPKEKI